MRRNDFIHEAAIAVARRMYDAPPHSVASFVDRLAACVTLSAPFDEAPAIGTLEAARLISVNDKPREAVAKTCTATDALRQENTALKERVAQAEADAAFQKEETRKALTRLAYILTEWAGRSPAPSTVWSTWASPDAKALVDSSAWEIRFEDVRGGLAVSISWGRKAAVPVMGADPK